MAMMIRPSAEKNAWDPPVMTVEIGMAKIRSRPQRMEKCLPEDSAANKDSGNSKWKPERGDYNNSHSHRSPQEPFKRTVGVAAQCWRAHSQFDDSAQPHEKAQQCVDYPEAHQVPYLQITCFSPRSCSQGFLCGGNMAGFQLTFMKFLPFILCFPAYLIFRSNHIDFIKISAGKLFWQ